jgi:phytanoyl-CoA hydroxylase
VAPSTPARAAFEPAEVDRFNAGGYVIARQLASAAACRRMKALAERALHEGIGPVEYEADVEYPGAPPSRTAPGGHTVRRLLRAYARDSAYREWALDPRIKARLQQLLGPQVYLSQAHHNCIMTKDPAYGTQTGWHRDIRYWAYQRPELVSVWLALGPERSENGALRLLPGSHLIEPAPEQLDAAQFLRVDVPSNQALLARAAVATLEPGDVLFFHCRLFHAAGRNATNEPKFSVVFSYRPENNLPLPNTRSSAVPDVPL